jgi:hypothetical protein
MFSGRDLGWELLYYFWRLVVKIEVGLQYFTRSGERVTALRQVDNPDYPIIAQTANGEEMYTLDGRFDKFEDSMMDLVRPAVERVPPPPPPPPVIPVQQNQPCLARYCTNDAFGGELCETCIFLLRSGKSIPKPHVEHEPKVLKFQGEGCSQLW